MNMNLLYSEYYAPTVAFYSNVYQIVVLERNFSPFIVGLESGKAVSLMPLRRTVRKLGSNKSLPQFSANNLNA